MPLLTRWFVRTALIYFMAALALGTAVLARPLVAAAPLLSAAGPGYLHLLTVGWITQLIIGVAYWLFPRPDRARPAPPDQLGWAAYVLLNTGLLLRVVAEPVAILDPASATRWLLPTAGLMQLGAAICFLLLVWPRVRGR